MWITEAKKDFVLRERNLNAVYRQTNGTLWMGNSFFNQFSPTRGPWFLFSYRKQSHYSAHNWIEASFQFLPKNANSFQAIPFHNMAKSTNDLPQNKMGKKILWKKGPKKILWDKKKTTSCLINKFVGWNRRTSKQFRQFVANTQEMRGGGLSWRKRHRIHHQSSPLQGWKKQLIGHEEYRRVYLNWNKI